MTAHFHGFVQALQLQVVEASFTMKLCNKRLQEPKVYDNRDYRPKG